MSLYLGIPQQQDKRLSTTHTLTHFIRYCKYKVLDSEPLIVDSRVHPRIATKGSTNAVTDVGEQDASFHSGETGEHDAKYEYIRATWFNVLGYLIALHTIHVRWSSICNIEGVSAEGPISVSP
jgi:hypothetical protein